MGWVFSYLSMCVFCPNFLLFLLITRIRYRVGGWRGLRRGEGQGWWSSKHARPKLDPKQGNVRVFGRL